MNPLRRLNTSLHRTYYRNFSATRFKIRKLMGAEFFICPDNYIDRRIWVEGGFEKEHLEFLMNQARANSFDAFLDIGTNFGLYSCIIGAAGLAPAIHSFECDQRNLYHLYGHLRMNGLIDAVTVHPYALGDANSEISFSPAPDDNTGKSRISAGDTGKTVRVQQRKLDDVLDLRNQRLLIKIDVEGYEPKVIAGMAGILKGNKALLQMEILEDNDELARKLGEWGYRNIHRVERDFYFTNMDIKA